MDAASSHQQPGRRRRERRAAAFASQKAASLYHTQSDLVRNDGYERDLLSRRSTLHEQRADGVRFQAWIRRKQFPADCSAISHAITRLDYFHVLGLGAQMVSLKFNLAYALLQGLVYQFPTSHYVNPIRCPSRSFECYFERPTNCSPTRQVRKVPVKIHWCFDLPRRRLSRLAGLHAVHSKAWYHAQLASFLFRPNSDMRAFDAVVHNHMESANVQNRSRSHARHFGINTTTCVGMHIRRTDKHTEDHRTAQRGFKDFVHIYKSWAYWSYAGVSSQLRVLLGSEDKMTFVTMPQLLAPTTVYWLSTRHFVMDMSKGKHFFDIKQGNQRLGELYDMQLETHKRNQRDGTPSSPSLYKDEGMALITQMLMMARCEAFIGSYASNVAILVHDLLLARKTSEGENAVTMDVNGRAYCGCGASFCMQLERKLESGAGPRKPAFGPSKGSSVPNNAKQIIDAFAY